MLGPPFTCFTSTTVQILTLITFVLGRFEEALHAVMQSSRLSVCK
jgi:hypothetical protein